MGLAPLGIVHTIYWFREPMTRALGLWSGTFCLPRVHTDLPNGPLRNTHDACSLWSFAFALAVLVLLSFLWGHVATALTIGWGNIESSPLVEPSLIEIPQMVAVTSVDN